MAEGRRRNIQELTTLDQWLDEESFKDEVTLKAITRVIALQPKLD